MKRALVLTCTLGLCLSMSLPASWSRADVEGGATQIAEADWTVWTTRTQGIWYIATAFRDVDPTSGVTSVAFAVRGTCHRTFHKHGWSGSCTAQGEGHDVGLDEFQVDPTLSSADLSFKDGRYRQVVHWAGQGLAPDPGVGADFDPNYQFGYASAGMVRGAKATATLFGRSLKAGPMQLAFLAAGAGAFVFPGYQAVLLPAGSIRMHRTISSG